MEEQIFALAKAMGAVRPEDERTLRILCLQAEEELTGRLREGVLPEDCEGAFVVAAAWMALAGLCAGGAADSTESFSAGDLTIHRNGGKGQLERGAQLRRQAELVMGAYLRDREFFFRGVPG